MAHASSDSDSDTGVNGRTTGSGSVPQGPFQLGTPGGVLALQTLTLLLTSVFLRAPGSPC